ncbi:kirola-like [Carica papaya]|uniref:kirola-like n=1 Tax=Carica papaya TaxID=3649 RepID=UPI000B8D091A|nr:kirola-like [Carica papaya]
MEEEEGGEILKGEVKIKSSGEEFFEFFWKQTYKLPKINPQRIRSIQLLEGHWGKQGAVLLFRTIRPSGELRSSRRVIEVLNYKKKIAVVNAVAGNLLNEYKYLKIIQHDVPKNEVKYMIEFEKLNDEVPDPIILMEGIIETTKLVDEYLMKNKCESTIYK